MDKIFVVRGTEQAGPFTEAEIRSQLASGAITGDTMIWWEGLPEWTPLSRTPLAALPATAPAAPLMTPPAPVPAPATLAPGAMPPTAGGRTSTMAIVSLVSALLGLVCGLGCIVAIVTGHLARKEIKRDPTLSGGGLALAGLIIGYIEVALIAVALIIYVAVIGVALHEGIKNGATPTIQDSDTNSSSATTPSDTNSSSTNSSSDTNSSSTNTPTATPTNP